MPVSELQEFFIDPGRCIYSYFGGSYVTLPPEDEKPA